MGSCIFALNNPLVARHLAFHGFLWAIMQMKIDLASEKNVQTFKICSTIFEWDECGEPPSDDQYEEYSDKE